jgi:hypothetical protein
MTDQEQPMHGGSYIRQDDGSLRRVEVSAPAEAPALSKPAADKPQRNKAGK